MKSEILMSVVAVIVNCEEMSYHICHNMAGLFMIICEVHGSYDIFDVFMTPKCHEDVAYHLRDIY